MNVIEHSLAQAKSVMERYLSDPDTVRNIAKASEFMADAIRNGGKVISCGNGGSCCDAAHFAEELTGRYRCNRRPLPAICINDPLHFLERIAMHPADMGIRVMHSHCTLFK